ncbi:MAG: Fic/DOC family N-terminal domain-containing protein [bacterium]
MSDLKTLPPEFDFDDVDILKKSLEANIALAELNGLVYSLPNYDLLLQPLTAREAVASSEIENIRTTTLDILQAEITRENTLLPSAQKETLNYKDALLAGYKIVKDKGFLATNIIVEIQKILEPNKSGIRTQMGTVIADGQGNVVHTPPQKESQIRDLMDNLGQFINNDIGGDPLVKMAIAHYQFESIHPFYHGNGRTGRILMILYLVMVSRLRYPVLFLSGYILSNKAIYYKLLQEVRTKYSWKEWALFILEGVRVQSLETAKKVKQISDIKLKWKKILKQEYSQFYSIEILDYLFEYAFYTQTHMSERVDLSRPTIAKYLDLMVQNNQLGEKKVGKERLFFIPEFLEILG